MMMLLSYLNVSRCLQKAGMESCKPLATPMSTNVSNAIDDTSLLDDHTPYRQLVGLFMYIPVTRPDLSFAGNHLCQFMHALTQHHLATLKRVLRDVKVTIDLGLRLSGSSATTVHAFSCSD